MRRGRKCSGSGVVRAPRSHQGSLHPSVLELRARPVGLESRMMLELSLYSDFKKKKKKKKKCAAPAGRPLLLKTDRRSGYI